MNKKVAILAGVIVLLVVALAFFIGREAGRSDPPNAPEQGTVQKADLPLGDAGIVAPVVPDTAVVPASSRLIDSCYHLESCSYSRILSQATLAEKGGERLVEGTLLDSIAVSGPKDGVIPKEKDLVWEKHTRKTYAVCSKRRPTIVFPFEGGWLAEEFDLTDVPGVVQNNANIYQALCHGAFANEVVNDIAGYGYAPLPDGGRGQFTVSSPQSYFSQR